MFTALSQKLVDSGWMGKISIPYSLKMNRIKNIDYVYFSYFSTDLLKHHDQETYKRQHVIWLTVSDAQSPIWQSEGTAENLQLDSQPQGRERTLRTPESF